MADEKQGTLNFDRQEKEQEPSKKGTKARAILFFAGLLLAIGIVIYVALSSFSFAADEQTVPTMADGRKQEEKLRKKRLDDEKRLGQMKDKLLENPRAKKDNYAKKVLKDFERIYEANRKKREKELKKGNNAFHSNLEKYGRFNPDQFGKPGKGGRGNVSAHKGYGQKKRKSP